MNKSEKTIKRRTKREIAEAVGSSILQSRKKLNYEFDFQISKQFDSKIAEIELSYKTVVKPSLRLMALLCHHKNPRDLKL